MRNNNRAPSKKRPEGDALSSEIEDLLGQVMLEEANTKVWQKFENSLSQLSPESLEIFERYLDGFSAEEIGQARKLSVDEVNRLITQIKRELTSHLKQGFDVRN